MFWTRTCFLNYYSCSDTPSRDSITLECQGMLKVVQHFICKDTCCSEELAILFNNFNIFLELSLLRQHHCVRSVELSVSASQRTHITLERCSDVIKTSSMLKFSFLLSINTILTRAGHATIFPTRQSNTVKPQGPEKI